MTSILSAVPNYPFPNNVIYKHGIMPAGVDHEKVQEAYENFMELYQEQGDMARIKWDTEEYTVSEGIGYGMMILVYMDNAENNTQAKFDKLWNYYNNFLDDNGLMDWKIKGFNGAEGMYDHNSATDAELDVAVGLLQAYKQWGDEKYLDDARTFIGKIAQHEVTEDGYLKPGDSWDSQLNPSYFSTAALELFKHASEYDWNRVITNSYTLLKNAQDDNTGLVPDWCSKDGSAIAGRGDYKYDAARVPWRIGWAYSWYGHEDARAVCSKMVSWVSNKTGNDASKVVDGYSLNGSELGENNNGTFVGPFACAGLVDAQHQTWLDEAYSQLNDFVQLDDVYYQQSIKVITLLLLSGNMPNLWDYPTSVKKPSGGVEGENAIGIDCIHPGTRGLFVRTTSSGKVTVSIHTVSGRRIATPFNGVLSAGEHWVNIDNAGPLTAGTYLVVMKTDAGLVSQRMVVTR